MSSINARPIWLPVLFENDQPAKTLLGGSAFAAKGAECRFMISIFEKFGAGTEDDPGTLFDVTNFVSFILKLWATDYGAGTLLLDTSDAASIAAGARVDFNYTATAAQFYTRTAAQIQVYLPAALTANVTAGDRFGVLTGATSENAAQPDWFGNFPYTSKEVGLSTVATPPAPAEAYVRSDVFQAALANTVKFGRNANGRYPVIVNDDGTFGTALRTGPNGEFDPSQLQNP